jgi:RNA polymerase sigma factor (sigma-70 family)
VVNSRRLVERGSRARMRIAGDARLTARIRAGDHRAFEAVYDRYAAEMLRFGVYLLGSRHDAEDAVQAAFTAAWRSLRADRRPVALRPWLFTITRNECVTMLRSRRPTVELNGELAITDDPVEHLIIGEDLRLLLASIATLPEQQRAALVLAEAHGLTHPEIASVLGVRTDQVKAFVYQARVNLTADRRSRESDCSEIRSELEEARGHGLLRGAIRRHLRDCPGCHEYAESLARRRRYFGAVVPFAPSLALKHRALEGALGLGGSYGGSTAVGASLGGLAEVVGGVGAMAFKVAAGAVALSVTAGVGVSALTGSQRPANAGVAAPQTSAADVMPLADLRPRARRQGTGSGVRVTRRVRKLPSAMAPSSKAVPSGDGPAAPVQVSSRVVVAEGRRAMADTTAGSKTPERYGPPATVELKRQAKATEREAGAGKSEHAQEAHKSKAEEHASMAEEHAGKVEEPHGNSEDHRAEGVAKGPPTEEEHQQKLEAHEQKQEEPKQAHPPKG